MGSRIQPGDVIVGKYVVERVIGEGGMGVVLAATHRELGRKVAVKVLRAGEYATADVLARFQREAKAVAKLSSDHVAHVLDVGVTEAGDPFIIMEHLEGSDLAATLETNGRLPTSLVAELVAQACEAIGEAHAQGIVHRDLKPSNLFLTRTVSGALRVKVLDFGISKLREPDASTSTTQSSAVLGTPLYMAPEQMMSSKDADARADIWSLGVVMFELLTGKLPWKADNVAALAVAVTSSAAPNVALFAPEVPAPMVDLVARCLSRAPDQRFQTAMDLAAALAPLRGLPSTFELGLAATQYAIKREDISSAKTELAPTPVPLVPMVAATTSPSERRRRPWWVRLIIAGVLLAVFGPSLAKSLGGRAIKKTDAATAPIASTAPLRHPCADQTRDTHPTATSCEETSDAWCDANEHRIACCGHNLVPNGVDGICECPPGGVPADAGVACSAAPDQATYLAGVKVAFRGSHPALRKCLPNLDGGHVVFWLDVSPEGYLYSARIKESTVGDPNAQACFLRVVRALKLPPPPAGTIALGWPIDITKD